MIILFGWHLIYINLMAISAPKWPPLIWWTPLYPATLQGRGSHHRLLIGIAICELPLIFHLSITPRLFDTQRRTCMDMHLWWRHFVAVTVITILLILRPILISKTSFRLYTIVSSARLAARLAAILISLSLEQSQLLKLDLKHFLFKSQLFVIERVGVIGMEWALFLVVSFIVADFANLCGVAILVDSVAIIQWEIWRTRSE